MRAYNQNLVIDILRKDYPEIEANILERIKNEVPEFLNDLSLVSGIVNSFIEIRGLKVDKWTSCRKGDPMLKERNLLVAVLILFYHPAKMLNISTGYLKAYLITHLSNVLDCPKQPLKNTVADVLVGFRAYKEFRDEAYRMYELIKAKNNLLQ